MKNGLKNWIAREAASAGFDLVGVTSADAIPDAGGRLAEFIGKKRHGTMEWMSKTAARRADPKVLWPEVRSIIMLGLNYGPDANPLELLEKPNCAAISVYAQNRDYHDIIKGRLKGIAGKLVAHTGCDVKVFVDTAPVMEKPLAAAAGLGWQGKHTNLLSRQFGSWLFLGAIFTTLDIPSDHSETDHCGSCRACLEICPTNAFPAPYQLDARRCISYLTIEHKGPIPEPFRKPMRNRIFGCDDCLAICPWNKFAANARENRLQARDDLREPEIAELLKLDDVAFRKKFAGSPVKRIGRDRFMRNVLIAAGNSANAAYIPACMIHLGDASSLVRGAAVWALSQLLSGDDFTALAIPHIACEQNEEVKSEWRSAVGNRAIGAT